MFVVRRGPLRVRVTGGGFVGLVAGASAWRDDAAPSSEEIVATPGPTVEELVDVYRAIQAEHPRPERYRVAMVADQRLVIRLHVATTSTAGSPSS